MSFRKVLSIIVFLLVFPWSAIFTKILSSEYNVITQNFYRFLFADISLFIVSFYLFRNDLKKALKNLKKFIIPAALTAIGQNLMVAAIVLTTAVLGALLSKLSVIFTVVLSFILIKEERSLIKSRYFLLGLLLSIIGFIGVALGRTASIGAVDNFSKGVILFLISAFMFGLYRISIKKMVKDTQPVVAFTIICFLMTLIFLPFVILFGNPTKIITAGLGINLVLFSSGFVVISLSNSVYYIAVRDFGVSVPNAILLLVPFITGIFSFVILKELLTSLQILFGSILLIGCYFVMKRKIVKLKHNHISSG